MKKWFKRWQWKISRWWYRVKLWFGWWYCEHCEKMHSPLTARYEFLEDVQECEKGVYDLPVPRLFTYEPEYFREIAKDQYRVR